jgi:(2Fe-2S) ferredoxin
MRAMSRFQRHLFVCMNERPPGHPRGCCAGKGAGEVLVALKRALLARGLDDRVRGNKAGCLDACEDGVSVVVYPEGVWYGRVTPADAEEIVERHIIGGEVVSRLLQTGGEPGGPVRPLAGAGPEYRDKAD